MWKLMYSIFFIAIFSISTFSQTAITFKFVPYKKYNKGKEYNLKPCMYNNNLNEITGTLTADLINPKTNQSISGWCMNVFPTQYFTIEKNNKKCFDFPIYFPIPYTENKIILKYSTQIKNTLDTFNFMLKF